MFRKLDCVCLHTDDLELSLGFYMEMGLRESWRLDRVTSDGVPWTLAGLAFPNPASSELVLSTHPERLVMEVEIRVDDVREVRQRLGDKPGVEWISEPAAIETGHVAVIRAPDGNVLVLIGG